MPEKLPAFIPQRCGFTLKHKLLSREVEVFAPKRIVERVNETSRTFVDGMPTQTPKEFVEG
jgi:hypothetical protein